MTSVVTLAPIAAQLWRSISLDALFPAGAVEQVLQDQSERKPGASEAELPEDIKPFFGHYCVVVRAATALLGAPAFRSLARFHDEVEEEYMPGGPPKSPVYDSFRDAIRPRFGAAGHRQRDAPFRTGAFAPPRSVTSSPSAHGSEPG